MNIKIRTKLITTKSNDFIKQISNDVLNTTITDLKPSLEKQFKNIECETHNKSSKGTITIVCGLSKKIEFKYSNFCCNEFKNTMTIKT